MEDPEPNNGLSKSTDKKKAEYYGIELLLQAAQELQQEALERTRKAMAIPSILNPKTSSSEKREREETEAEDESDGIEKNSAVERDIVLPKPKRLKSLKTVEVFPTGADTISPLVGSVPPAIRSGSTTEAPVASSSDTHAAAVGSEMAIGTATSEDGVIPKENAGKAARPFVCQVCHKGFTRNSKLREHVRTVHLKERRFVCPVEGCGKKYASGTGLRQHRMAIHEKKKPFGCRFCSAKFGRKWDKDRHEKTVHSVEYIALKHSTKPG